MPDELVSNRFRLDAGPQRMTGVGICGSPLEMSMLLDFTGPRGSGSNLYYSYVYQVPKWDYNLAKVDEWMEVSPEWAEFHSITIGQKQKIMETIKSGLTSAAAAVTDYDLLSHDLRRYKEILDYFKAGVKDEHVLRSLFVDRVDAHTGEGYSIITMARRWPTIITDFISMKEGWTDPEKIPSPKDQIQKIKDELDVSQAEATVLKTKNELFREWKKSFLPVVKERYARIENMVLARKKSIDEYKKWLKPYLVKLQMMREKTEVKPAEFFSNPYTTPGFGQSQALTGVRTWCWKPLVPAELRKPGFEKMRKVTFRDPDDPKGKKTLSYTCVIDPYDDLVRKWIPEIEKKYSLKISDDRARKIVLWALGKKWMDLSKMYYVFFDANIMLSLVRTPPPESMEGDNLMVFLAGWFMSQNSLLIHIIEMWARERALENYVNEMIGAPEREEKRMAEIEEEFAELMNPPKPERMTGLKGFVSRVNKVKARFRFYGEKFFYVFVKRGPYETMFFERISKLFARGMGGFYGQQVGFIKEKMGVY